MEKSDEPVERPLTINVYRYSRPKPHMNRNKTLSSAFGLLSWAFPKNSSVTIDPITKRNMIM